MLFVKFNETLESVIYIMHVMKLGNYPAQCRSQTVRTL